MTTTEVIRMISAGVFDAGLDGLAEAVAYRKKMKAADLAYTIAPGTKVRLSNLRPKYMVGATGEVLYRKQTRIQVKLDEAWLAMHPQARRFGAEVAVSAEMITVIP